MGENDYTGADDGVWETAGNWSRGVPAVDDDIVINVTRPANPVGATSCRTLFFSNLTPVPRTINLSNLTVTGTGDPTELSITVTNRSMELNLADWTGLIEAPPGFLIITANRRVTVSAPTYPDLGKVLAGTVFGVNSEKTGTYVQPAAANVRSGVQYGNPDAPIDGGATFTNAHGGMGLGF
jgi:hypothetical protein